ncbi:hypothetical protein PN498_14165 [Oscillatoria sp. CS-180]|uniref:hypothetical protein n=1 Tax=Oscillatoria sp. CS-180 TaxID=3021720 RepID=UPI00232F0F91|nr:hypothetical protein [Oscillatoria sp. CS-180]MDB9527142.1 hypothetical protein [Oscillatoria sp. CS-180]
MQVSNTQWSSQELAVAKAALRAAYERETASIVQSVREKASEISHIDELWHLNDFLSARRFDIDGKYDDREEEMLFVLAKLVKESWLTTADLDGLDSEKLTKMKALTHIL